ncbi:cholesterol side-chain cleavage enzyme, mitochondrial-like [Branchiostoma lanceolatum]|uniref:cholesterol side-chain cleavage enzyme, mitochondrial-like n=1 Tax=Branchiostoma lanceolatum TaxID=7740 RepID=UPI0034541741
MLRIWALKQRFSWGIVGRWLHTRRGVTSQGLVRCQTPSHKHSSGSEAASPEQRETAKPFSALPQPLGAVPPSLRVLAAWWMGALSKEARLNTHIQFGTVFKEYGPIWRNKIGSFDMVHLCDPDAARELFKSEGKYPERIDVKPWRLYREGAGKAMGIILSNDKLWHKNRTVISRLLLRPQNVARTVGKVDDVASEMIQHILSIRAGADGTEVLDLENELFKWALESISAILFNERMGLLQDDIPDDARDFIDSMHNVLTTANDVMIPDAGLQKLFNTKSWQKHQKAWSTVFQIGEKVMERQLRRAEERQTRSDDDDGHLDFLSLLSSSEKLTKEEIYASTIELMGAAIDTTSTTLLWTLYALCRRPDLQDKLYQEVTQVIGQDEVMTWDHLKNLHLMKAIIKETLRLYPVAFVMTRVVQQDTVLMGYEIPAKTTVMVSIYHMARDPKMYKDPDEYRPERWLRSAEDYEDTHPYAYLPFGFGTRSCIGRRVAETELQVLLAKIVQRFVVKQREPRVIPAVTKTILLPSEKMNICFMER